MAKKPFLKLRRLYEDQGLLQKELSELSGIPLDPLKGRLNAAEDKDIPVIFTAITDPVGAHLDAGNITGTSIQLGGTTLLIVVGVALETGRSLEGYMTARYHKGFLE